METPATVPPQARVRRYSLIIAESAHRHATPRTGLRFPRSRRKRRRMRRVPEWVPRVPGTTDAQRAPARTGSEAAGARTWTSALTVHCGSKRSACVHEHGARCPKSESPTGGSEKRQWHQRSKPNITVCCRAKQSETLIAVDTTISQQRWTSRGWCQAPGLPTQMRSQSVT